MDHRFGPISHSVQFTGPVISATARRSLAALALVVIGVAAFITVGRAEARSEDSPFVPLALDPTPVPGPGVIGRTPPSVAQDWRVHAFAETAGRIYVGGAFTQVRYAPNGGATTVNQPYLAAFDLDTNSFISSFRPQFDDVVWALEVDDRGRLIVGGEFDTVNGTQREGLVALDPLSGAIDSSFTASIANDGSNFEPSVRSLQLDGNQLYVVGDFNRIVDDLNRHGTYRAGRVRTSDGRKDTSWQPRVSGGGVYDVAVDAARSQVVLVGTFTSVGATPDTNGGALVGLDSGAVVPNRPFATNGFGNRTYGVGVLGDTHFIGGEQHHFQGRAAGNWAVRGFVSGGSLAAGQYVSSGHGGDIQFVDRVGDYVVFGCHCHGNIQSTFDDEFTWGNNRPVFIADASGSRQNPILELPFWNEGPYWSVVELVERVRVSDACGDRVPVGSVCRGACRAGNNGFVVVASSSPSDPGTGVVVGC